MTYKVVNGKLVNTSKGWGGGGAACQWRADKLAQSTPPEWHPSYARHMRGLKKSNKQ